MGYKRRVKAYSTLRSVEITEGEPIELKIERVVSNTKSIITWDIKEE